MINYKDWNIKALGNMVILGIVICIIIALFQLVVSPLLVSVLPTVFASPFTLTETLLFFILVRLFVR